MASTNFKFVCKDDVSELLEKSIQEMRVTPATFNPDSSFHPSQITECPRRLIYRSRGLKTSGETILDLCNREFFKNKWISILEKSKSLKVLHKDVIASDCNYNLYSKVDAVVNISGDIFAIKAFSVISSDFEEIHNKGARKKDVIEMVIDIWLLEVNGGIIMYEAKEICDFCVFHIKPYKPIIDSVTEKCMRLLDFKLKGQVPDRPYKTEAKECYNCEYLGSCWENKQKDK